MNTVAIVIPTHNRADCLKLLLTQLNSQANVPARVHIIVVNDGSVDGTQTMLEKDFSGVTVVRGDGTWWYTRSVNEGLKAALGMEADTIITLNDDIEICPDYLSNILSSSAKYPDSLIGSISLTKENPPKVTFSGIRKKNRYIQKSWEYLPYYSAVDMTSLSGTFPSMELPGRGMLIPVRVLKRTGLFDELFFQYGSDYDFCTRARKFGFQTFISHDAVVYSHDVLTRQNVPGNALGSREYFLKLFDKHTPYFIPNIIRYSFRCGGLPSAFFATPVFFLTFIINFFKQGK